MRRKVPLNWISFWTSSFLQPFNFFPLDCLFVDLSNFFFLFILYFLFTIKWKKILYCNSIISPTESIVLTKHFSIWQKKNDWAKIYNKIFNTTSDLIFFSTKLCFLMFDIFFKKNLSNSNLSFNRLNMDIERIL